MLFLQLASKAVYEAVGRGEFEQTEDDRPFLLLAGQWRAEH